MSLTRYVFARMVLCVVACLAALGVDQASAQDRQNNDPFSVVMLSDTQGYVEAGGANQLLSSFKRQVQWIVRNYDSQNVAFVSHVGGLVEHGGLYQAEWDRANEVLSELDSVVPYSVGLGIKDYDEMSNRLSPANTYASRFGAKRYLDKRYPWYGQATQDNKNHFQVFKGGKWTFLHVTLEHEPSDDVLRWAQAVFNAYPQLPTIVSTHAYMWDWGRCPRAQHGGNSGQQIWDKLIRHNPQVFMVLGGHYHYRQGERHQTSVNNAGFKVYEMLASFQGLPNAGGGFMRIIQFLTDKNKIQIRTYSPITDQYMRDDNSEFTFDIDFERRFSLKPPFDIPSGAGIASFQQGVNGYAGTVDTFIQEDSPTMRNGEAAEITVDADEPEASGKATQMLLRFDKVFGTAANQVPPGSNIVAAILELTTVKAGDGATIHRVRNTWNDSITWRSLRDGLQPDGTDAFRERITTGPLGTGLMWVDVTSDIREWSRNPQSNHGWALLPLGSTAWKLKSSESDVPPRLTIVHSKPRAGVPDLARANPAVTTPERESLASAAAGGSDLAGSIKRAGVEALQRVMSQSNPASLTAKDYTDRQLMSMLTEGDVDTGEASRKARVMLASRDSGTSRLQKPKLTPPAASSRPPTTSGTTSISSQFPDPPLSFEDDLEPLTPAAEPESTSKPVASASLVPESFTSSPATNRSSKNPYGQRIQDEPEIADAALEAMSRREKFDSSDRSSQLVGADTGWMVLGVMGLMVLFGLVVIWHDSRRGQRETR